MSGLSIQIVSATIPGAAPVSAHSRFTSTATAKSITGEIIPAENAPRAEQSRARRIRLDGEWRRRAMAQDPADLPVAREFDDSEWDRVFVPNNYGLEPSLSAHFGPVFYRCRLAPMDAPHASLLFDAVDYFADVWLDGEHLGHHEGYFAPFSFDVSGKVRAGSVLTVRAQDPYEEWRADVPFLGHAKRAIKGTLKYHDSRPGGLPGVQTPGWNARLAQSLTTGGITASVWMLGHGPISVDALFATPLDEQHGIVHVAIVMTNHGERAQDATVDFGLTPPEAAFADHATIRARLEPGPNRVDAQIQVANPRLWWPVSHADLGAPALYRLDARAICDGSVSDEHSIIFGIRTARVEGEPKRMVLNGRPIFVQAANYIPRQHFADADVEFYRRDMRLAAAAHLNSFGVHGHVQTPKCYTAADQEGILIFQDFALQWHYDSGRETNPGFIDNACRQIAEMAYTYWNHPSIVYWACHNEPNAMFIPDRPRDEATDPDNQVLDEALEDRLRAVEPIRHVHRASGIGDDLHLYDGSLSGGSVYGVRKRRSWFVSEYGFWTLGPGSHRWNDQGWPPDEHQMKQWLSRLSFGPSTMSFAGLPERYPSLDSWRRATEAYGAFLAKYQTEWLRINRGAPFMAIRWHFFADWWGWAGGGLLDVDRNPKATYLALKAASRATLVATSLEDSTVRPGARIEFPIYAINETRKLVRFDVEWRWWREAESIVIGVDREVNQRFPGWPQPRENAMVAVPAQECGRSEISSGKLSGSVAAESALLLGTLGVQVPDDRLAGATLELRWSGGETNWFHVLAADEGWFCGPGAFIVRERQLYRLGESA